MGDLERFCHIHFDSFDMFDCSEYFPNEREIDASIIETHVKQKKSVFPINYLTNLNHLNNGNRQVLYVAIF